jgi:hypothetical protein
MAHTHTARQIVLLVLLAISAVRAASATKAASAASSAGAASAAVTTAPRSCLDKINDALTLASQMPPSPGRSAALTDITRARDDLHDGDTAGCNEQIDETFELLQKQGKQGATPAASQ